MNNTTINYSKYKYIPTFYILNKLNLNNNKSKILQKQLNKLKKKRNKNKFLIHEKEFHLKQRKILINLYQAILYYRENKNE